MSRGNKQFASRAVFFVVAAWILLGPVYRQVLGGTNPVFLRWVMFSRGLYDLLDVRLFEVRQGQRFRVEGLDAARFVEEREVVETARRLCEARGDGADVRAVVRRMTDDGWIVARPGDENLCTGVGSAEDR